MFESGNASSIPMSPPYELVVSGRFENGATHEALTLPESIYYLSTCWVSDWRILKCFSIRKKDESAELSWGQRCTLHAGGELLDVSLLWNIQKNEETKSVSWFLISWSAVWAAGPFALFHLNVVGFRNKTHFQLSPLSVLSVNFPKTLATLQV